MLPEALIIQALRISPTQRESPAPQEWNEIQFNGVYYAPPKEGAPGEEPTFDTSYTFNYPRPKRPENLRIYECHVGMSSEEPRVCILCWPSPDFWDHALLLHIQS